MTIIFIYVILNVLFLTIQCLSVEEATKDMELLLAVVVHRYGERTPEEAYLFMSENKEEIAKLCEPYEAGSITNKGKARAYEIGKYLRQRYNSLLSKTYIENEIYLKTSDFPRTRQTLEISITAMYTENADKWTPNLKTLQIPYNVTPLEDDIVYNIEYTRNSLLRNATSIFRPEMMKFRSFLEFLTAHTPFDFTAIPLMVYFYFQLITSEVELGIPLPKWIEPHWLEFIQASDLALHLLLEQNNFKRLIGGLFLNDFIEAAKVVLKNNSAHQRVRVFSEHDMNLAAVMADSLVEYSPNKLGAVFSLELYKMKKNGEYYVLPVYLLQAGNVTATVLSIEGCGQLCSWNDFTKLTENNGVDEETLKKECEVC